MRGDMHTFHVSVYYSYLGHLFLPLTLTFGITKQDQYFHPMSSRAPSNIKF